MENELESLPRLNEAVEVPPAEWTEKHSSIKFILPSTEISIDIPRNEIISQEQDSLRTGELSVEDEHQQSSLLSVIKECTAGLSTNEIHSFAVSTSFTEFGESVKSKGNNASTIMTGQNVIEQTNVFEDGLEDEEKFSGINEFIAKL